MKWRLSRLLRSGLVYTQAAPDDSPVLWGPKHQEVRSRVEFEERTWGVLEQYWTEYHMGECRQGATYRKYSCESVTFILLRVMDCPSMQGECK